MSYGKVISPIGGERAQVSVPQANSVDVSPTLGVEGPWGDYKGAQPPYQAEARA